MLLSGSGKQSYDSIYALKKVGSARRAGWRRWLALFGWSYFCVPSLLTAAENAQLAPVRPIESAFESKVVKLKAKPDDKNVSVEWTYTNHWDFPLAVERFEQSCGCLSGQVAQASGQPGQTELETVPPGKRGTIRASFTPGAHRGLLRKSLHVRFIGHDKPVELVVEAMIPSSVELSTRELVWKRGKKTASQTIEVTSGTGADFTITGLQGVPETQFAIRQEAIVPKRHYRIHITPAGALPLGAQCLQVRTDSADPRDRVLAVFLSTEAAPAAVLSTP